MENQRILDTYYYKLPAQDHQQHRRENQRCRDDISRVVENMIPLNNSGYETQVIYFIRNNFTHIRYLLSDYRIICILF